MSNHENSVARFRELDERMQWYVDQKLLGCLATVILHGDKVVHRGHHGSLSAEGGGTLPEDAIFRMYSNTKLVTSVALMMLHEQGAFALDDPLGNMLPQFANPTVLAPGAKSVEEVAPAEGPILIRHVLSHSAGWSYGFIEPESVIDQAYGASGLNPLAAPDMTLASLCDGLAALPLCFQPGTDWRYSFATDVCARLVEVLSGQSFDDFLQERIFGPLEMVDTGFWVPEEKRDRFTTMYGVANFFDPMEPGLPPGDDPQTGMYTRYPSFLSGGGGLVSTVADYTKFFRMMVGEGAVDGVRLLQPETLLRMRTNQLADGVEVHFPMWAMPHTVFGLGLAIKTAPGEGETEAAVGEYYWGGLAGTHSWAAPAADLAGLCFAQRMPGFWHPFAHDFKRLAYATR